jgi:hypothetical protein
MVGDAAVAGATDAQASTMPLATAKTTRTNQPDDSNFTATLARKQIFDNLQYIRLQAF